MRYLLYCLIAILLIGTFLPEGINGGIHNIYFFIALVLLIVLISAVKLIKYICFCMSIKKELKKKGFSIIKFNIFPAFLYFSKNKHIIAELGEKQIDIIPLYISRGYLTYHFENIYKLELYKSTRFTVRPHVRQANIISGHVGTKKVFTKKLKWLENSTEENTKMLIFNKYPALVKDSLHNEGLSNGDKILDEIYLFDLKGLEKISEEF